MITKRGTVTSAKMHNTVTVTVHRSVVHPLYKKAYRMSKKFLADTAGKDVKVGDIVLIGECRPLSKRKHFQVLEILKKAAQVSEISEGEGVEEALRRKKTEGASSESSVSSPL